MKKSIIKLSFILISFFSYSQIGFGVGYESSGNVEYNSAIKINIESLSITNKKYLGTIIGFELGINFLEDDQTGKVNMNPQEETGNYLYTIITPAFKFGKQLTQNGWYIVAAGGLNLVKEHREYKSSNTGIYSVETDYKKNSPYFRAGIQYIPGGWFNPGLGFGTNGIYLNNTFHFGKKIKTGIINRKDLKEKMKINYQIAGNFITELKFDDYKGFVKAFIDDCKENGIVVNEKNIIAESKKGLNDNIIAQSYGKDNDDKIEIYFNKKEWKKANINTKLYVLYNQLARDVLNFELNEGGKMTSKLNQTLSFELKDFKDDRKEMFEIYNQNQNNSGVIEIEN